MWIGLPPAGTEPERCTVERYFALSDAGVLGADDRVELLEGVIVAMSPSNPLHAAVTGHTADAIRRIVGERGVVREQHPLVLGLYSVPEPDIAIVPGTHADYVDDHPRTALLVVEVADWSLAQDRLTKARIYAAAGIPEYWIVNLRDECIEVHRGPEPGSGRYATRQVVTREDTIDLVALANARLAVDDLLPRRRPTQA
jgi:Uma2 family endonuclease